MSMLALNSSSAADLLRSIHTKSIEEVVVSRKANSVLGMSQLSNADWRLTQRSNSFLEPTPMIQDSDEQVAEAYRSYLQSTSSSVNGGGGDSHLMDAYNEMRERCLMLTERVMQLEQVAHGIEEQRDKILDQKEKTVELKDRIHTVSFRLENLDKIFNDNDAELLADAATLITAAVRGFLTRRRVHKGRRAFTRWKTEQTVWLKSSVSRWMTVQRMLEHSVVAMRTRRRGAVLSEIVAGWMLMTKKALPKRRKRADKLEIAWARTRALVLTKTFTAWNASATGKFSRKAVKRSYERRKRRAELAAMDKVEAAGFEGEITEEMVMTEMTAAAVEMIEAKHMQIKLGDNVANWREGGKSKKARRHRGALLQRETFLAWMAVVEDSKSADGGDWVAKHQIKLKMRKMFRGLMQDVMVAWSHVASTRKIVAQRSQRIWNDWMAAVFVEFRDACQKRRGARTNVVETMRQNSQRLRGQPFQAWHVYAVESRVWKHAIALYTQVGDRRRSVNMLRWGVTGWKRSVFNQAADDQAALAETVRQLQAQNEALQAAGTMSVEQAEAAVQQQAEAAAEREKRATDAEEAAKKSAVELETAEAELLRLKAEIEQKDIMIATRSSAGGTPPAPAQAAAAPSPAEPSNPNNSEVTYEELLLLNRAKWALSEFEKPPVYAPEQTGGGQSDDELRRLNTIIDIFTSGQRQQVSVPPGVRLPPVKPPSREALAPENTDLKWDEFLTGLDQFDKQHSKGAGSSASSASGSRPGSKASQRAGGSASSKPGSRPGSRGV